MLTSKEQDTQSRSKFANTVGLIARVASVIVILVGCLVLLGWSLDISFLKSVVPGSATMKANTAVCFVLSGTALALKTRPTACRNSHRIAQACAIALCSIGTLTLSQYLLGWNLGIDELLFRDMPISPVTSHPGRMGANTAINFISIGAALGLLSKRDRVAVIKEHRPSPQNQRRKLVNSIVLAQSLSLVAGLIALQAIAGYAYGVRAFYRFSEYTTSMALHTAVTFAILCLGILAVRADCGLMGILTSDLSGGIVARLLIPGAIAMPLLLGWLILQGQRAGLYDTAFSLTLFAVALIIVLLGLIGWSVVVLNRVDSDRKRRELNEQFLNELDLRLRQLSDPEAMAWEVVSSLGEYLNVDRCLWHEIDWEHRSTTVERTWHREDVPDVTGTYALDEYFTPNQLNYFAAGQTLIVCDVTVHPGTAPYAHKYLPLGAAAFVSIPCIYSGCWVAVLAVNAKTVRNWREDEVVLMQEIVARLWSVIEHTRAVQELRERENRYRTLFETVDQGFCICEMLFDENGEPNDYRFLEINPAFERMTGLKQAVGKTARELVPNLEPFWVETYGKVAVGGESARFENRSEVMNRWFDVYACRIGEPQSYRFAILFTNITDRKRSEAERAELLSQTQAAYEQAQTANRLKDEFLAALSHELRTPLNPILGWTKLLQRGNLTPAKTTEALAIIERNVKQQVALVEDLLDVSRILQGKFNLTVQPVDLALVVNAAIETVHFAAIAKSITLEFQILSDSITRVMGDEMRLQQVFWNLLSNAIKFTPDGGRVEVKLSWVNGNEPGTNDLEQTPNYAQVQIIDTGIGIAPAFLPYVFDDFRQADGSSTRKYGGLGLGLAIVKHLLELQGGTVIAASPGEGQGATFTVSLPLLLPSIAVSDRLPG
jgi:PAS domain S-box-containing protein